jgi:tetratricopeptide (TPR) repeat protein/tRNA A-37 threonylcarbamoyl transferase component Bud32
MANAQLEDNDWLECERCCRRFEAAWQEQARPPLDDFLPVQNGAYRDAVLAELVHLDLEFRLRAGDDVRVESYLRQYPQLGNSADVVLELIEEEFTLRQETDRDLSPTEFIERFPPFAPEIERRLSGLHGPRTSVQGPSRPNGSDAPAGFPLVPGCEILEDIGRGGMGIVYKAKQMALDRIVAIKMVRTGAQADEEDRARFQTEVRAAAQLRHVNIVQIHEVGELGGQPYCILEYVPHGTLQKLLAAGPRPPRDVAVFAATLARAVHFAHQNGIVHRDLKPGNILLQMPESKDTKDGDLLTAIPKIADFGLAKRLEQVGDLTETGMIVGTVQYMAPEQADGKTIGPSADIYALGAVLYEMLTGRPPLLGHSPLATLEMLRNQEPISLCRLQPSLPRELDTICMKCLEKDPARRYASAAALADDLDRFLAGEPIHAQPMGRVERTVRWCRRKPALAGLWASLVVLFVGVLSVAFWQQQQQANRTADDLTRKAEARRKRELAERGVAEALDQGKKIHDGLLAELAQPTGVTQLLNDPARWSAPIATAYSVLARAAALRKNADSEFDETLVSQMDLLALQIMQDDADRRLALRLEKIRLDRATWSDGTFDIESALRDYPTAFQQARLCAAPTSAGQVLPSAAAIGASAIKEHLLAAIDDWADVASVLKKNDLAKDLRDIASQIDRDPWRDQIRKAATARNVGEFTRLADKALADEQVFDALSPQMMQAVGRMLTSIDGAAKAKTSKKADRGRAYRWLNAACMRHPSDFWLNFDMGNIVQPTDPAEAIGYFRTAVAVRKQSGAAWNNFGNALRRQGNVPASIRAFKNAVAAEPQNGVAWSNLGMALLDEKKMDEALAACNSGVDAEPNNASAWNNLGVVLAARNDKPNARLAYEKAIALNEKLAKAWNNLSNLLRDEEGQVDDAIAAAKKAIRIDPNYARGHNTLGLAHEKKKEYILAIAAHEHAIKLERNNANFWFNLANTFRKSGAFTSAIPAYRETVKIDDQHVSAWTNLGVCLRNVKEYEKAVEAYNKALAIDDNHLNAWVNLGRAYSAWKKPRKAEDAYEKALLIDPKHVTTLHNVGVLRHEQNNLKGAIEAFRRAIEVDSKAVSSLRRLGVCLRENRDAAGAVVELTKALAIEPNDASTLYNLGQAYGDLQDHANAVEAYRKSAKIRDSAPTQYYLGMSLRQQGKLGDAAKAYSQSIKLKSDIPNSHLSLALVYRDLGRFVEAEKAINAGIQVTPFLERVVIFPQLAECQELIKLDKRLPLVLAGKKSDAKEQLALADLCYRYKKMPDKAVTLYSAAFAQDASLADKFTASNRTNAALAAVLASSKSGADAPKLRKQALTWLNADLKICVDLLKSERENDRTSARERLELWRKNVDLLPVRVAAERAKLPPEERSTWQTFWSEVDALEAKKK